MNASRLLAALAASIPCAHALAQDFGNAVWFDGVNDQVVSTANFDTTRLTVEAWVYLIDLPQGSCGLAAWGRNSDAAWEVGLGNGSVAFAVNWNKPTEKRFLAENLFNLQTWTHIAVTYDDTFARLYINGDLVHSAEFNMPILPAGPGAIMALNNQFPGINELGQTIFDEVRIWNLARSQDQLRCAMSHEIDPATPGLLAYYRFNDPLPGSQAIADSSPAGRGATLGSSPSTGSDDPVLVASAAPFQCLTPSYQPVSTLRGPRCSMSMSFEACGEGTIQYQWYHAAAPIPGATSPILVRTNLTLADSGNYTCIAFGDCGIEISDDAYLTVCVADFDCTGTIDGDDLVDYFAAWDQNDSICDVDDSGGVDGDDVIVFMTTWESGC